MDDPSVPDAPEPAPSPGLAGRMHSASLWCENCGEETPHRILRLAPGTSPTAKAISGTARCRKCEWTHSFTVARPVEVEVSLIISDGPTSVRRRVRIPAGNRLELAGVVPGTEEPVYVRRIETHSRHSVSSARPGEVATIWASREAGAVIPVSVVEGARTWTSRLVLPRQSRLSVGDEIRVANSSVRVVALRARGRTWRLPGDSFGAEEVQRVYTRRTDSPPAGSSDWRRSRGTPSSRASSFSRSSRSRSGPGVMRTRRSPPARSASGGATHQRVSPS
jgi:uncharacterized Zn finger protein